MRHGRLVETGPLQDVLRNPKMEYTRNLLSSVPSLVPRAPRPETKEPVVLEANELSKVYRERSLYGKAREVAAASNVTLTLRKGRTLGIVGESGSGKSVTMMSLLRLLPAPPAEAALPVDAAAEFDAALPSAQAQTPPATGGTQ